MNLGYVLTLFLVITFSTESFCAKIKDCDLAVDESYGDMKDPAITKKTFSTEIEGWGRGEIAWNGESDRVKQEKTLGEELIIETKKKALPELKKKCAEFFNLNFPGRKSICEDAMSSTQLTVSRRNCSFDLDPNCIMVFTFRHSIDGYIAAKKDAETIMTERCTKINKCMFDGLLNGGFSKKESARLSEMKALVCGPSSKGMNVNDSDRGSIKDLDSTDKSGPKKSTSTNQ